MIHPQISVIVPIYNAELYLRNCLDSLLAQSYTDFEVILINDGSTDLSINIIKEYTEKDSRFLYINKHNEGVGATRQRGLDEAKGEYIIHCDPDDTVSPFWLERLHAKITKENADMAICDFRLIYKEGHYLNEIQKPTSLAADDILKDMLNGKLHGSCCNKLVRKKCIDIFKLKFNSEMSLCEDLFFNCQLLLHDIKIAYLPDILYYYDNSLNNHSATRNPSIKELDSKIKFIDFFEAILTDKKYKDGLYIQKKQVKSLLFRVTPRKTKALRNTYKEINNKYIEEAREYAFWTRPFCISLCIKGYPWWIGQGMFKYGSKIVNIVYPIFRKIKELL